jgi:hypothetical protein
VLELALAAERSLPVGIGKMKIIQGEANDGSGATRNTSYYRPRCYGIHVKAPAYSPMHCRKKEEKSQSVLWIWTVNRQLRIEGAFLDG